MSYPPSPPSTIANEVATAVMIVDDHELLRIGVRACMASYFGDQVEVIEATRLSSARQLYGEHEGRIRLVLLDLNLPDSKGLTALRTFKAEFPGSRVGVLSGATDESIASEARSMGAEFYLTKGGDMAPLLQAIRAFLSHSQPSGYVTPSPIERKRAGLSPRELEVLDLLLQGCSNTEISEATGLKLGTVKNYVSGLMVVFGATSRHKLLNMFG